MSEIALIGDSIFDNKIYAEAGMSVKECLQNELGNTAEAVLYAVDGSITEQVIEQFESLSTETSHIFISSGGNDGLGAKTLLNGIIPIETAKRQSKTLRNLSNAQSSFDLLAIIQQEFRVIYRKMLQRASKVGCPITVCTIYDKNPTMEPWHRSALAVFNDVISYEAVKIDASIIDLRAVCEEKEDYSNISPIEPSGQGSTKIAAVMKRVLEDKPRAAGSIKVYS